MPVPDVDQLGERPLDQLVQSASQEAVALAREQLNVARQELTARARQAGPGVAMVGAGAVLAALASGTGTAALIRMLGRRPGAAAALGVTGAYAGGGAFLARRGLSRIREAGPSTPETPVADESVQADKSPAKRRAKSPATSPSGVKAAAQSSRPVKSAAKSPRKAAGQLTESKAPRRRASSTQPKRTRRPVS